MARSLRWSAVKTVHILVLLTAGEMRGKECQGSDRQRHPDTNAREEVEDAQMRFH